jgi:hypothetical protein
MNEQVDKQLVDEAMDAYVDWREECAGVWDAYERWARAPKIDAVGAFSAYRAALDREECARAIGDIRALAVERLDAGRDRRPRLAPSALNRLKDQLSIRNLLVRL